MYQRRNSVVRPAAMELEAKSKMVGLGAVDEAGSAGLLPRIGPQTP
jgi:hypothetical protein